MFFCKEIFGDVPKALSVKGLDGLSDTSNFLDRLNCSVILHFSICTLPFTLFGSGSSGLGQHDPLNIMHVVLGKGDILSL